MIAAAVRNLRVQCDWAGLTVKNEPTDAEGGHVVAFGFNVDGDSEFDEDNQPVLHFEVQMPGGGPPERMALSSLIPLLFEDPDAANWDATADPAAPVLDVEYKGLGVKKQGTVYRVARILLGTEQTRHKGRILFVLEPAQAGAGRPPITRMLRDIKADFVEHLEGDTLSLFRGSRKTLPSCKSPAPTSTTKAHASTNAAAAVRTKAQQQQRSSAKKKQKQKKQKTKTSKARAGAGSGGGGGGGGKSFVGRNVRKYFPNPGGWYEGTVDGLSPHMHYHVTYADGDEEEYTLAELLEILVDKPKGKSAARKLSTTVAAARAAKKKAEAAEAKKRVDRAASRSKGKAAGAASPASATPSKRKGAGGGGGGGGGDTRARVSGGAKKKQAKYTGELGLAAAQKLMKRGVTIRKEFVGFGFYQGTLKGVDVEARTGRVLYHVEYEDGDEEDLYFPDIEQWRVL